MEPFLPVNQEDMRARGWGRLDFLLVTGDAYVDHPSFGHAIISRVLVDAGYRVGIVAQPDWRGTGEFTVMGAPRYAVLVTGGNLDSMVNHYTAAHKIRNTDAYSPGGAIRRRPDRASIVYANLARQAFPGVPVILGGLEASLRRFAHYDYWSDKVRRSILLDSKADLLVYGMGERAILAIAARLAGGGDIRQIRDVRGTVYAASSIDKEDRDLWLPSYEEVAADPKAHAVSIRDAWREQDAINGRRLIQPHGDRLVVQNPPAMPLDTAELDHVYELPYARTWHPMYAEAGGVPAIAEVRFSVVSSRGCYGACSFCSLAYHQGRCVTSRSHDSILREVEMLARFPDFKGYIHDVGGPTANFYGPACDRQRTQGACKNRNCLYPSPCANLKADHSDYLSLLRKIRKVPGVKKVFIRSGVRFDYLMADEDDSFFREMVAHHVSGQLKVAPEHVSDRVLSAMGKPPHRVYEAFQKKYFELTRQAGLEQYLVPYFISGHPGSTLADAIELAEYIRDMGYMPEQVQDFYPTPGTLSTCMYATGIDPRTMKAIHVPKGREKTWQRALLQYRDPRNRAKVIEALTAAGRRDLIGYGPRCLVRPADGGKPTQSPGQPRKKKRR
jgi:uncharacterized radical SAM protein YgiQ